MNIEDYSKFSVIPEPNTFAVALNPSIMAQEHKTNYESGLLSIPVSLSEIPFVKLIIGEVDKTNIINLSSEFIKEVQNFWISYQNYSKSEHYLIIAIHNFLRKLNYSELNESLDNGEMTEDQFYSELDNNSNKYIVKLKDLAQPLDVLIISDIMKKIGFELRDFSLGEVSEMFSIKEEVLAHNIEVYRGKTE